MTVRWGLVEQRLTARHAFLLHIFRHPLDKTQVTKESHCAANGPVTYLYLNGKHIASKCSQLMLFNKQLHNIRSTATDILCTPAENRLNGKGKDHGTNNKRTSPLPTHSSRPSTIKTEERPGWPKHHGLATAPIGTGLDLIKLDFEGKTIG